MPAILSHEEVFGGKPARKSGAVIPHEEVFGSGGVGQPEELTMGERLMSGVELPGWMVALSDARDRLRGTAVEGFGRGMLKPFVGAVQLGANAIGAGDSVNREVDANEARYQANRAAQGREGFDAAEFTGEVVSPFNAILAAKGLQVAKGGIGTVKAGAALGGAAAASQPVVNAGDNFFGKKTGQVGAGVVTGAALAPAMNAISERAVRWLVKDAPDVVGARASLGVDDAIKVALRETGQTIDDVPASQLQALREDVLNALKGGKKLDAAAAIRRADFDALGIKPTLGQVTRDPVQFAKEKGLQSVIGAGDDLTRRYSQQNARLGEIINKPASGAADAYTAGERITQSLSKTDDVLRRHVSGLYREARDSAGKDLDVPLTGLAQDYAQIVSDFGDKVPSAIRGKFAALGLDPANPANQKSVFTIEDAEKLLKVINDHVGGDRPTNTALGKLRASVRAAVESADPSGGPFAPAVKAARERFGLQDAVPALKAAAEGSVPADHFVNRFIVNGNTKEVLQLGKVLKQTDPAAWGEARAQMAEVLRRAAFGENPAADAPFSPTRYMQTIRKIGPHKLGAFFNAQEMGDILRVGRVGAYMRALPADSPVNTSRTAGALMWMMDKVPGGRAVGSLGQAAARTVKGQADARNALAASVPVSQADLTPRQQNFLALLLSLGAVGGGVTAGSAAR